MTYIENKLATWFFSLIGYFNHYSFFTEKLWQQIQAKENEVIDACYELILKLNERKLLN